MMDTAERHRMPTSAFCTICYWFSGISLAFEFLPADCFAIFSDHWTKAPTALNLAIGGFFLGLGILLHAFFYRRDPERFDVLTFRNVGLLIAGMMASLFGLSFVLARYTNLTHAQIYRGFDVYLRNTFVVISVFSILLIVVGVGAIYVSTYFSLPNRMARCFARNEFAKAIQLAEAVPEEKRNFAVKFNLAMAYAHNGDKDKANMLLADFEQPGTDLSGLPPDHLPIALNQLREAIQDAPQDALS